MKKIAIALGSLATAFGVSAFAQYNADRNYPYDPDWAAREQARQAYRDNYGGDERRLRDDRWRDDRWQDSRRECWNPRARHFEGVREGERQDDLDFSRCRVISDGYNRWR
jgi:hypothetical protein